MIIWKFVIYSCIVVTLVIGFVLMFCGLNILKVLYYLVGQEVPDLTWNERRKYDE